MNYRELMVGVFLLIYGIGSPMVCYLHRISKLISSCFLLSLYLSMSMSIYLCLSIFVYLFMSMSIYVYLSMSIYLCLSIYVYVYVYLSMSISIYLCLCLSIYVASSLISSRIVFYDIHFAYSTYHP